MIFPKFWTKIYIWNWCLFIYFFVGLCSMLWEFRNEPNRVQNGAKMNEISMLKSWGVKQLSWEMRNGKWQGELVPHWKGMNLEAIYKEELPILSVPWKHTLWKPRRVRSTLNSHTHARVALALRRNVALWWRALHFLSPLERRLSIFDHARVDQ